MQIHGIVIITLLSIDGENISCSSRCCSADLYTDQEMYRQMYQSFFVRIKNKSAELKGKQKVLAAYLTVHYKKAAFMNSASLAQQARVSEATVNRFAHTIGYGGFTEMINALRAIIQNELTTIERVQEKMDRSTQTALERVVRGEKESLRKLMDYVKQDEIDAFLEKINSAGKIIILGFQVSASLAGHFAYLLSKVTGNVQVITELSPETHVLLNEVDHQTLIIPIAYPRYPNALLRLTELFANRGATIVAITNSLLSPVVRHAAQSFLIPLNYVSTVDQFGSVLVFIQAVILGYVMAYSGRVGQCLAHFEAYVAQNNIFHLEAGEAEHAETTRKNDS